MNIRNIYKLLIPIGLLISCTNHQNDLVETISEENIKESDTEAVFNTEKTKLVFLEQDSDVVVGEIRKMISSNGDLFILSGSSNNLKKLFRYSSDGKFKNQIGTIGGSSNEYISLSAFCIQDDRAYIIDSYRNKMLVYSIDGTFIQTIKGKDGEFTSVFDAASINDENVLLYNGFDAEPGTLYSIYNIPKKKVINEIATDISAEYWGSYSDNCITKNSTNVFFFIPLDKSIYAMNDDYTKNKAIQVDYLGKVPNYSSTEYEEIAKQISDSGVSPLFSIFALEDKFLINLYSSSLFAGSIIWDISNHSGRFINDPSRDINSIFPFLGGYVKCSTEDGFIAVFNENSFRLIIKEHKPSDLFNNSESEIESHLYDGSPILVRYYLK